MSGRYTMTLEVRAWQIPDDDSLPEEARDLIEQTEGGLFHDKQYWYWETPRLFGGQNIYYAVPGSWIVSHEYGIEVMTDEAFRARCVETK